MTASSRGVIEGLDSIHDSRIEKIVVLSPIEDLKANLKRLPKDLRWIAYNTEPAMTPGCSTSGIFSTMASMCSG